MVSFKDLLPSINTDVKRFRGPKVRRSNIEKAMDSFIPKTRSTRYGQVDYGSFNSKMGSIDPEQWTTAEKFLPKSASMEAVTPMAPPQQPSLKKPIPVTQSGPARVSKKFSRPNAPPSINTTQKRMERPPLGAQKAGWGKPVPLLGLTKAQAAKVKSDMVSRGVTKSTVDKMSPFRNRTVEGAAVPGRYFSNQAAWIAAAAATQQLSQYRLDPYNPTWGVVDQVGSIVSSGLSYVDPILGALAGPVVEGIAQLATQAAKNNAFEGSMGLGSKENMDDFKRYAKYLEDNPDSVITQDEWKAYDNQLQAYEGKGCQKMTVTPEMLNGKSLEEYFAENDIKPAGPPPQKPKSRGSTRAPTQEEIDALKNARLG